MSYLLCVEPLIRDIRCHAHPTQHQPCPLGTSLDKMPVNRKKLLFGEFPLVPAASLFHQNSLLLHRT